MLSERQKDILKTIVEEYIKTARAIGSKSLCKKYKISSATIRSEMNILEEFGYLEKQHISAGRMPSEKGYRYYVDHLMEIKKITGEDMLKLETIFSNKSLNLNDAISKSLEIVSDITNYTSIILGSASKDNLLEKVEVVPINENKLVAIVITNKGHVENKEIDLLTHVSLEDITKTIELLNKMLSGTPIDEVPSKLEFDIKPIIKNYVTNYEVLYNAFYSAFTNITHEKNVKFAGKSNILKQPEFSAANDIRNIVSKFESEDVSKIEESDDEVKIYIGKESEFDDNVTIVKTKYKTDTAEGTIAIIGPKRMEYNRVVSMLDYIKEHIERR
ncbi:MAG: heat-inducible transcriptional repressor HrcA [Bacilli bacterium]